MPFSLIDGFEHGDISNFPTHLYAAGGSGTFALNTTKARNGGRCLKLSANSFLTEPTFTAKAISASGYILFEDFPDTTPVVLEWNNANGKLQIRYHPASGKFEVFGVTGSLSQQFGPVLALETYYRLDVSIDTTANPAILIARATEDGGTWDGTEGTVSPSQASADCTSLSFACGNSGIEYIDDVVQCHAASGPLSEAYPIGEHQIEGLYPDGDGTHNVTSSTSKFERTETGTKITNATTTAYQLLDDVGLDPSRTDYIKKLAETSGSSTEYVEVTFPDLADLDPIDVKAYGTDDDDGALASSDVISRVVLADGTAVTPDIRLSTDDPGAGWALRHKILDRPGGGWTLDQVNGLKARFGWGTFHLFGPNSRFHAFMLEVVCRPAIPPIVLGTPGSIQLEGLILPVRWQDAERVGRYALLGEHYGLRTRPHKTGRRYDD